MRRWLGLFPLLAAGCAGAPPEPANTAPTYRGVQTALLDGDLVQFNVAMSNVASDADVERYAQCAAAQYTLIRGYGFARHLRTAVRREGDIWRGDAVYTISPALPRGTKTLDAEVVAASCAERGIPAV